MNSKESAIIFQVALFTLIPNFLFITSHIFTNYLLNTTSNILNLSLTFCFHLAV